MVQATPSFDYPWRYQKADHDEEIVPLVAPLHQRTTASTERTSATAPSLEIGAASNTVSSAPCSRRRHVSFSLVRIREYSECLGDHPWCPQYPCSLDWTYDPHETLVDMDVYEQARDTCCWSTAPRRMDVLERRCRLARAMRITKAAVDVMEAYRQQQQAVSSEPVPPCDDLHIQVPRVPTMIVLPPPDKNQRRTHSPDVSFLELEGKEERHERRCGSSSSSTQRRHQEWI